MQKFKDYKVKSYKENNVYIATKLQSYKVYKAQIKTVPEVAETGAAKFTAKNKCEVNLYMRKMRTVKEAYAYIKELDSGSRITLYGIRTLCQNKDIHSVRVGKLLLLDLDELVNFLCG